MTTVIPHNKSKQIDSRTLDGAGVYSIDLNVEQSAVALVLFVSSMASSSNLTVRVYNTSYLADDQLLIYDSGLLTSAADTPLAFEIPATGVLRIDLAYSGTITYALRGKAIDRANHTAQEVVVVNEPVDSAVTRKLILKQLKENNDTMQRVLNQLRYITQINDPNGDKY